MNQSYPPRSYSQKKKDDNNNVSQLIKQDFSQYQSKSNMSTSQSRYNQKLTFSMSSTTCESSRRNSQFNQSSFTNSNYQTSNDSSLATKQSQSFQKQSKIYQCLQQSIQDLVCQNHSNQEIEYFCSDCKSLICQECIQTENTTLDKLNHGDHSLLGIHQFMDYPVLSFFENSNNQLLMDFIMQSKMRFSQLKEQIECQKKILREYLNSLLQWIQKKNYLIQDAFDKQVDLKLEGIHKQMDIIQEISNIYKNEWDNCLSSNNIQSKQDLETICKQYIESNDNPQQSIQNNYNILNSFQNSIPELNIQALKDLYLRITDEFRFSFDNLITQKTSTNATQSQSNSFIQINTNNTNQKNNSINTFSNNMNILNQNINIDKKTNFPQNQKEKKSLNSDDNLFFQKNIEVIQEQYSNIVTIQNFDHNQKFQVRNLIPLSQEDKDTFIAIGFDQRTVKFMSAEKQICQNTIIRGEGDKINNIIPLKDKKHIIICTNNFFEIFSIKTGKVIFTEKMNCIQACEIPSQRIVVSDSSDNLNIYCLQNLKNIKKINTLRVKIQATNIDFTTLSSDIVFANQKQLIGDQDILAIGGSETQTQADQLISQNRKCTIQIWNIQQLHQIKQLKSTHLNSGIQKLKFIKTCNENKDVNNLLLSLTNDSYLLVWDIIYLDTPSVVVNLIPLYYNYFSNQNDTYANRQILKQSNDQNQYKVCDFDYFGEDKVIYTIGQQILVASISQSSFIGSFYDNSHSNQTTESSEYQIDYNESLSTNSQIEQSKYCLYTSLVILGKNSNQGLSILASKYYPKTQQTQLEMFSQ